MTPSIQIDFSLVSSVTALDPTAVTIERRPYITNITTFPNSCVTNLQNKSLIKESICHGLKGVLLIDSHRWYNIAYLHVESMFSGNPYFSDALDPFDRNFHYLRQALCRAGIDVRHHFRNVSLFDLIFSNNVMCSIIKFLHLTLRHHNLSSRIM